MKEGDEKGIKIVKAPKRFESDATTKEEMGFSDHFPILVQIDFPEAKKLIPSKSKARKR